MNSVYEPRFFVCTTSPNWGNTIFTPRISTFVHNLRNGYDCKNFVWTRELQKNGAPHYHFVADMDFIYDPVRLSEYWSSLFSAHARNSVRLGSKPDKEGRRTFILTNESHARYLSSYIGKNLGKTRRRKSKLKFRSYGISLQAGRESLPTIYEGSAIWQDESEYRRELETRLSSIHSPEVVKLLLKKVTGRPYVSQTFKSEKGETLDPKKFSWTKHKIHNVWFGKLKHR